MGMKVFRLCSNSGPVKTPWRRLCTLDSTDQRPSAWFCSSQSAISWEGGLLGGVTVVSLRHRACRWNKVWSQGNVRVSLTYYPEMRVLPLFGTGGNFQSLDERRNAYLEPLPKLFQDKKIVSGICSMFLPAVKAGPATQTIAQHEKCPGITHDM